MLPLAPLGFPWAPIATAMRAVDVQVQSDVRSARESDIPAHLRIVRQVPCADNNRAQTERPPFGGLSEIQFVFGAVTTQALACQRSATMTAVVADGRHGMQIESGYRGDDIDPGPAFDADRLKGEGVAESADKAVGRSTDTERRSTGSADISASERTWSYPRRGREDGPSQGQIIGDANLCSEPLHGALVVLCRSAARGREDAIERARRKDDIACGARASAVQQTCFDICVCGRRRQGKAK